MYGVVMGEPLRRFGGNFQTNSVFVSLESPHRQDYSQPSQGWLNTYPIAEADFFYEPRILVFVDGSPHYRDYVQAADEHKRRRLKALGYRVVVVRAEDPEACLDPEKFIAYLSAKGIKAYQDLAMTRQIA